MRVKTIQAGAGMTGFTLIELMLTILVAAVLLSLAIPSYRVQILNSRMAAATNDMMGSFHSAKSESVGRSNFITMCKRNAGGTACVNTGGWEQGWLIFADDDGDGAVDGGEEILYAHGELEAGITARGTAQVTDRVTYRPNGLTNLTSTQVIVLCDERGFGADSRGLVLTVVGKASSLPGPDTAQVTCLVAP